MDCVLTDPLNHKVGCAQQHSTIQWKSYMWLGLSRLWRHKWITWISGPNAHDLHFCYITFFLPAYTYGLMGSSLTQFTEDQKTQALSCRWLCRIWKHYSKVDSCRTIGWRLVLELTPSDLLALRHLNSDWNFTIDSPTSSACQLQTFWLFSLQTCVSQYPVFYM